MPDLIFIYKSRVPYSQVLDAPFHSKKHKSGDDILEISKQVKVNLSILEAINQILAYAKFHKDMCTLKRKSKDDKSKKVILSEQVSTSTNFDTPPNSKYPRVPTI